MAAHPGLPKEAFTIQGGCNCHAVRYRVSVPEFGQRPMNPYKTPGADIGNLRVPMVVVCHCNNCRSATAAVLPMALVTDIATVEVSVTEKSTTSVPDDETRAYVPADGMFDSSGKNARLDEMHLAAYKSSPGRSRWFCSRCGTPIGYSIDEGVIPPEWGWPKMLDIWLGTIDRSDLDRPWMAPERMLWCEKGVPWIRGFATQGAAGIPEHPLTKIDRLVGDEGTVDEKKDLSRMLDRPSA